MAFSIINADCIEAMRDMPESSVDSIVTDPPYGIDYQSAWRTDKAQRFARIANDRAPFIWWLLEAVRLLKDGGCVLCFCRWDTAEAFRLAMSWAGLTVISQIIWDREHHGMGNLRGAPAPRHDTIWLASRGKYQLPGKRPTSVVRHGRLSGSALHHPNEKPKELMADLVRSYVPEGGAVLDPFMGSGSTGVAAVELGYDFIGIEAEQEYAEIAQRRIEHALELAKAS